MSTQAAMTNQLASMNLLSEVVLGLLIYMINERFDPLVSEVGTCQKLEREVLHLLCIEPMSYSALSNRLFRDLVSERDFLLVLFKC